MEKPRTATGIPPAASSSNEASAVAAQSLQFEAGMTGPGPSWPGKTGARTLIPASRIASITGADLVRAAAQAVEHQARHSGEGADEPVAPVVASAFSSPMVVPMAYDRVIDSGRIRLGDIRWVSRVQQ